MNKLLLAGTAAGALAASAAAQAQGLILPVKGNIAIFGSYLDQNIDEAGLNPEGGGGGVQLGLSFTNHFFVSGSYEYDYLYQSNAPGSSFGGLVPPGGSLTYGERVNQARAGGGFVTGLFPLPMDIYGKVEYVHYDYQYVHGIHDGVDIGNGDRFNDDGVGFHVGLQSKLPFLSVYGSIGYLSLSQSSGPEFNMGFEVPVLPLTWAFLEYRYDDLKVDNASEHNQLDNVHAGLRMTF